MRRRGGVQGILRSEIAFGDTLVAQQQAHVAAGVLRRQRERGAEGDDGQKCGGRDDDRDPAGGVPEQKRWLRHGHASMAPQAYIWRSNLLTTLPADNWNIHS